MGTMGTCIGHRAAGLLLLVQVSRLAGVRQHRRPIRPQHEMRHRGGLLHRHGNQSGAAPGRLLRLLLLDPLDASPEVGSTSRTGSSTGTSSGATLTVATTLPRALGTIERTRDSKAERGKFYGSQMDTWRLPIIANTH